MSLLQRREMAPEPRTVAQQPVVFDFINIVSPADSRLSKHQRLVRSRAALKPTSAKQPRGKRKSKQAGAPVSSSSSSSSNTTTPGPESSSKLVSKHPARVTQLALQNRALGQGRVDPFRTYPVAWQPFMPALIDHRKYCSSSLDVAFSIEDYNENACQLCPLLTWSRSHSPGAGHQGC